MCLASKKYCAPLKKSFFSDDLHMYSGIVINIFACTDADIVAISFLIFGERKLPSVQLALGIYVFKKFTYLCIEV